MVMGKEYHRLYNVHVRGRPEKADSFVRVKCLVCGNLAYPSAIKRFYDTYAKVQRGYNQYFELGHPSLEGMQGFLREDIREKYTWMARKCATQLRRFMSMGLITEKEISDILGLQVVQSAISRFGNHVPSAGLLSAFEQPAVAGELVTVKNIKNLGGVNYAESVQET